MPKPETPEEKVQRAEEEAAAQVEAAATAAATEAREQGLSEEEVSQRVQKARQEEKDKLYPQIEELKNMVKELQEENRRQKAEREERERKVQEEAERHRLEGLSAEERSTEAIKRLEERLEAEKKERENLQVSLAERDRKQELAEYRKELIKSAEGKIIPELVAGKSKEEIDASFSIAKSRYAELEEHFKQVSADNVRGSMPRPTNLDTSAQQEADLPEDLTNIDLDKYANDPVYRLEMQNRIAREYERSYGR